LLDVISVPVLLERMSTTFISSSCSSYYADLWPVPLSFRCLSVATSISQGERPLGSLSSLRPAFLSPKGSASRQRHTYSVCLRQGLLIMRSGLRSPHYLETSERRRW